MRHCLVAAGSNALRRAAMRPRGDGALLLSESTPHLRRAGLGGGAEELGGARHRLLNTTSLMHVRALSRVRAARES